MTRELILTLEEVTRRTVEALTGGPLEATAIAVSDPPGSEHLVATMDLAGEWLGQLVVAAAHPTAAHLAAAMLREAEEPEEQELRDALGELANVLAGNLRQALDPTGMLFELSFPRVQLSSEAAPWSEQAEVTGLHLAGPTVAFHVYLLKESW